MNLLSGLFMSTAQKAAANLRAGQNFLEANKEKPGVNILPSGLQYEVIKNGDGDTPYYGAKVTCHYHGTLIDGTVFESSLRQRRPPTFPVHRLIRGWREGLQMMPAGSKWRLYIPPELGYGNQQVSAKIGPNMTLIFEVELLHVN